MSAKDITMTPTVLWFLSSMTHQNPDIKYQSQIPIRYHHSNTFIDTTIPQHQTMADLGNVMVVSWNRAFSRSSSMWGFPWHNHFWIISGNPNQLHPHPRSIPGLHSRHEAGPQLFLLLVAHSLGRSAEPEKVLVRAPKERLVRWGERLETDGGGIGKFNLRLWSCSSLAAVTIDNGYKMVFKRHETKTATKELNKQIYNQQKIPQ